MSLMKMILHSVRFLTLLIIFLTGLYVGRSFVGLIVTFKLKSHDQNPNKNVIDQFTPDNNTLWPSIERQAMNTGIWAPQFRKRRLFVITPTVKNPKQIPDLTRMAQALYPVRYFVTWFIFEDSDQSRRNYPNQLEFIQQHLLEFIEDPNFDIHVRWSRSGKEDIAKSKAWVVGTPRGVEARRDGLDAVRTEYRSHHGVIFFADDDNTYEPELFQQILSTKKVSTWPVGFVTMATGLSSPVVNEIGMVIDLHDGFVGNRIFPIDFAGMAVNKDMIMSPRVSISYVEGYEETMFLKSLGITLNDIEPLGEGGTKVLAYHTRTLVNIEKHDHFSKLSLILRKSNVEDLYNKYYINNRLSLRKTAKKASTMGKKPRTTNQIISVSGTKRNKKDMKSSSQS